MKGDSVGLHRELGSLRRGSLCCSWENLCLPPFSLPSGTRPVPSRRDTPALQGTSSFVRLGGKARFFGLVGLGAADKAASVGEWGPSTWEIAGNAVAAAAKVTPAPPRMCFVAWQEETLPSDDSDHPGTLQKHSSPPFVACLPQDLVN